MWNSFRECICRKTTRIGSFPDHSIIIALPWNKLNVFSRISLAPNVRRDSSRSCKLIATITLLRSRLMWTIGRTMMYDWWCIFDDYYHHFHSCFVIIYSLAYFQMDFHDLLVGSGSLPPAEERRGGGGRSRYPSDGNRAGRDRRYANTRARIVRPRLDDLITIRMQ